MRPRLRPKEVPHVLGIQIHVVQKHGAQLEVLHQTNPPPKLLLLFLLLLLDAPDELLLAQHAVLNAHRFLAHVLYNAIVHEGVYYPKAGRRLRMQQIVVQVQVQVRIQV